MKQHLCYYLGYYVDLEDCKNDCKDCPVFKQHLKTQKEVEKMKEMLK